MPLPFLAAPVHAGARFSWGAASSNRARTSGRCYPTADALVAGSSLSSLHSFLVAYLIKCAGSNCFSCLCGRRALKSGDLRGRGLQTVALTLRVPARSIEADVERARRFQGERFANR
eukprot:2757885-Pleurochrysis_carterae.AAC.2